ncbi:MAG: XTP/dITP diphosphatase [Candidatus Hadarchaeaceae archaeon]
MALIFVTGNRHKAEEVSELAARHGIELEHRDTPYIEIQADELEQVVRPSVQQACALLRAPCFVEDAGLFVRALRDFPGPYSNFVFRTLGNEGIIKLMSGEKDRRAEFRSAIGYCEPGEKPEVFTGKVEGSIALEGRGARGFGFDPIFLAENTNKTFGEMEISEKNRISHRARALEKFFKWYLRTRESPKGI